MTDTSATAEVSFEADVSAIHDMQICMHKALDRLIRQMQKSDTLPSDLLFCVVVAELELLGHSLGAAYQQADRDDIYGFVRDDGLTLIEGAMRVTEKELEKGK